MRIFQKPNKKNNWRCPICNTNKDGEVVLIEIEGTEKDNIVEAEQVHLKCLDLIWNKEKGIIYQIIGRRKK